MIENKHYNKILKLISKSDNIDERKSMLVSYINRFNKSSYTHSMSFYNNLLIIKRIDCGYTIKSIEIDMSQYFDVSIIRNNLIENILSGSI